MYDNTAARTLSSASFPQETLLLLAWGADPTLSFWSPSRVSGPLPHVATRLPSCLAFLPSLPCMCLVALLQCVSRDAAAPAAPETNRPSPRRQQRKKPRLKKPPLRHGGFRSFPPLALPVSPLQSRIAERGLRDGGRTKAAGDSGAIAFSPYMHRKGMTRSFASCFSPPHSSTPIPSCPKVAKDAWHTRGTESLCLAASPCRADASPPFALGTYGRIGR